MPEFVGVFTQLRPEADFALFGKVLLRDWFSKPIQSLLKPSIIHNITCKRSC